MYHCILIQQDIMREARMDDDSMCSDEIILSISNYPDDCGSLDALQATKAVLVQPGCIERYCKQMSQSVRLEVYSREPSLDLHLSIRTLTLGMDLDVLA
jgi:hypothetical protein